MITSSLHDMFITCDTCSLHWACSLYVTQDIYFSVQGDGCDLPAAGTGVVDKQLGETATNMECFTQKTEIARALKVASVG